MPKQLFFVFVSLYLLATDAAAEDSAWQLVSGADGDGAWVAVTGHWGDDGQLDPRLDEPGHSCRWTVQVGDESHTVDDEYLIPEEGICILVTADALPSVAFPPTTGMTVKLQILRGEDLVFDLPERTLSWDPATLVSTRTIRAGLESAGWEYRIAEQVPSWGEGHRWFGVSLERDSLSCLVEFNVGAMSGRVLPDGVPTEHVAMGPNHQIQVAECTEPAAVRPRGYEVTGRPDVQLELVTLLNGLVQPPAPEEPTSLPE